MKVKLNKLEANLSSGLDTIIQGCMILGAVVLVPWIFVFVGSIIARNWFHVYIDYLEEYTGYWALIVTCLALTYTFRVGGHIRTDAITSRIPQRVRDIMEIFVALIAVATSCILAAAGIKLLLFAITEDVHAYLGTRALLWPVYLFIPIGYGLLSVALIFYFFHVILVVLGKD